MSTLKVLFTVLVLSLFIINPAKSKDKNVTGDKAGELNSQIVQEVTNKLQIPYLKFESKNLTGKVNVTATVNNEGRIVFKDVTGINENLRSNVFEKLNSLNLWTSPDYSGKVFTYNINYKN